MTYKLKSLNKVNTTHKLKSHNITISIIIWTITKTKNEGKRLWEARWSCQKRKGTRTTVELWVSTVKELWIFCMQTKLLSLKLPVQELQVATTIVQAT